MTLAKDLRNLKKAPTTTATYPSLFRDVLEDYLHFVRDNDDHQVVGNPRVTHSQAGMCARRIGYQMAGVEGEPTDAESQFSFEMGKHAHQMVQTAFENAFGDAVAKCEFEVDLDWHSCHIDIVLKFDQPQRIPVDGVIHLCRTIAVELKSTGGYSWSLQVKEEGPKLGAYLQGCLNAAAVDADMLVIGYLALDRQNRTAQTLYGKDRLPLDAVWATWAYPREAYMPDAEKELKRLERIVEVVDSGRLPERVIPGLPRGARITNPATGDWTVSDQTSLNIFDAGRYWGCAYCPFRERCVADKEAEQGRAGGWAPAAEVCSDCQADDHEAGSILCPYTADSCSACGGYHDSFYNCMAAD